MRTSGLKAWAGPKRIVSCIRMFLWHMVKRLTHADWDLWNIHINYRQQHERLKQRERETRVNHYANVFGCLAGLPTEKTLAPVIGSIVLLTQITIMMALLCQESGRQKAGNGWESRKGSREACGGERWRKAVCVTTTGKGEEWGWGLTNRHPLYVSVSWHWRPLSNP